MRDFSTAGAELAVITTTKNICSMLLMDNPRRSLSIEELTLTSRLNNSDCLLNTERGFTPLQWAIISGDMELAHQIKLDLIYFFGMEESKTILHDQIMALYKTSLQKYIENCVALGWREDEEYKPVLEQYETALMSDDIHEVGLVHDQAQSDYAAYYQNESPSSYEYFITEIMDSDPKVLLNQYRSTWISESKSLEYRIPEIYHHTRNLFLYGGVGYSANSIPPFKDTGLYYFLASFSSVVNSEIIANPYHHWGLLERMQEIEEVAGKEQDEQVKRNFDTKIILLKSWLLNWVKEKGLYSNRLKSRHFQGSSSNPGYHLNLNKESLDLFLTPVVQADRSREYVISSQAIGEQSELVTSKNNSAALYLLRLVCLKSALALKSEPAVSDRVEKKSGTTNSFPYKMPYEVWMHILEFCFGLSQDKDNHLAEFGALTLIQSPRARPLIPRIKPLLLADAAMRGEEPVVLKMLEWAPYLLNEETVVKNSVGVVYEVTVLQAAAMCHDVQLIIKMKERYFDYVPDGLAAMRSQLMALYKTSLQKYRDIQSQFAAYIENIPEEHWESHYSQLLLQSINKINVYESALNSNDICVVFDAHDQAQQDYVFNYQYYIDSILSERDKSQLDGVFHQIEAKTEAEAVKVALRIESDVNSLAKKLHCFFRPEFIEYIQNEVIANPYHANSILATVLKLHDEHARSGSIQNFDDKYLILMYVLYGWASRNMSECQRQECRCGHYNLSSYDNPVMNEDERRVVIYERMFHGRCPFFLDPEDRQGEHPFDKSITDPYGLTGWGYQFFPDQVGDIDSHSIRMMRDSFSSLLDDKREAMRQLLSELPAQNKPRPIQSAQRVSVGIFSPLDERRTAANQSFKRNKPQPAKSTPSASLTM